MGIRRIQRRSVRRTFVRKPPANPKFRSSRKPVGKNSAIKTPKGKKKPRKRKSTGRNDRQTTRETECRRGKRGRDDVRIGRYKPRPRSWPPRRPHGTYYGVGVGLSAAEKNGEKKKKKSSRPRRGPSSAAGCGGWSEFAVNRSQSFRRNIARRALFSIPPPVRVAVRPGGSDRNRAAGRNRNRDGADSAGRAGGRTRGVSSSLAKRAENRGGRLRTGSRLESSEYIKYNDKQ